MESNRVRQAAVVEIPLNCVLYVCTEFVPVITLRHNALAQTLGHVPAVDILADLKYEFASSGFGHIRAPDCKIITPGLRPSFAVFHRCDFLPPSTSAFNS